MRFESLLYFVVTADCHSMSDASEVLHVSHQCISRELKSFEDEIGPILFSRSKKGVNLTEEGKIIYHQARDIIKRYQSLETLFHNDNSESHSIAYYTGLKEIVEETQELLLLLHPTLFFTEFNLSSGRSLEFIKNGQTDFIVTQISKYIYPDIANDDYEASVLYQEPLLVALHKSKYMPNIKRFDLENLKYYPIAFFIENTDEVPLYHRIAQQFGWAKIAYNGNDHDKLWRKASEEGACLLATGSTNITPAYKDDFIFLPVKQDIKINTCLFCKKDLFHTAIGNELAYVLKLKLKRSIEKRKNNTSKDDK